MDGVKVGFIPYRGLSDAVHARRGSPRRSGRKHAPVSSYDLFVVLPIEGVLLYATVEVSAACGVGVALACAADILLVVADIAVADFGVSLTVYAAKSISSGHKGKFEWIIIPAIIDLFKSRSKP